MDEQARQYQEAKLMEPIYRMYKVIEEKDRLKAQTLIALVMQYITDQYAGTILQPADVQTILRAMLLREEDGSYYAMYAFNDVQVKVAGWLTLLAVDRPITLEALGNLMERFAMVLQKKDFIQLSAEDVLRELERLIQPMDSIVFERIQLNRQNYLTELRTFLVR